MAIDMKQLMVRAGSGIVYVALIVLACWTGPIGVAILSVLFAALGLIELEKMIYGNEPFSRTLQVLDVICCVSIPLSIFLYPLVIFILAIIFRFIAQLYVPKGNPVKELSTSILSIVYLGFPLLAMNLLSLVTNNLWYNNNEIYFGESYFLLAIFCMIWINDTGAFLVGSMFGRHKLFMRISPKKTWEGFLGGLIFNIGAGVAFYYIFKTFGFYPKLHLQGAIYFWIFTGILVSVFGTFGDLIESLIKRSLGLKDSGHLIPGHGGILDRIDSLLLVMPTVALYFFYWCIIHF